MWWNKHKWQVIIPLAIVIVLGIAFWYGGSAPGMQGLSNNDGNAAALANTPNEPIAAVDDKNLADSSTDDKSLDIPDDSTPTTDVDVDPENTLEDPATDTDNPETDIDNTAADNDYAAEQGMEIDPESGTDRYLTTAVPEGQPIPVEPQDVTITDTAYTCTLSVRCDTILDNISWLNAEKVELVPADAVIFPVTEVVFYEGESVFNVLQREMKKAAIHFEFSNTPVYNSAYIEGINNIYEFDCGEFSGWMYKVNDWFPNYGSSRYQLKAGDVIEWVYTCDLGKDVGGHNIVQK